MTIRDWPASERPREKLLQRGSAALSDAELLAIILRTGIRGRTAVDLARDLLQEFGSLRALLAADRRHFCTVPGLGAAKYAQMQAILEIARRHLREALDRGESFTRPELVCEFLQSQLRDQRQEVFAALFLDSQHRLLAFEPLFHGTIDGAAVYPREVARRALKHNAAAAIVAHNHPSGLAEPSRSDRLVTERLRDALALLDVRLLDHFVVGDGECVSLAERGWM